MTGGGSHKKGTNNLVGDLLVRAFQNRILEEKKERWKKYHYVSHFNHVPGQRKKKRPPREENSQTKGGVERLLQGL